MNQYLEIQIQEFPFLVLTDVHLQIDKVKKLQALYPNLKMFCLGDITDLFKEKDPKNAEAVQFFIDQKIPLITGNHEAYIRTVMEGTDPSINISKNRRLIKPAFALEPHQVAYLASLPVWFKFVLPNKKHYLGVHNRCNDLWCRTESTLSESAFLNAYLVDKDTVAVIIGHQHRTFTNQLDYKSTEAYLQAIGSLQKTDEYALVYENNIEIKKL